MTELHRLKKAIELLKEKDEDLTNEGIAAKLGYGSSNYISDIVSGSKPINKTFLKNLEREYSISKTWIETGNGLMINEETIANESNPNDANNTTSNYKIEINTSGKKFIIAADNKNEIKLLNAYLAEKDERQKESEQRAEKAEKRAERAEQEKDRLFSMLECLTPLLQITKRIDDKLGDDPDA